MEEDEVVQEEIDVRSESDLTDLSSVSTAPSSNPSVENSWINLEHRQTEAASA